MKLLNRLANPYRALAFALLAAIQLLITPAALAADNPNVEFSQAELDQMLAPIALYPDALLSQVLIASTYPLEIIQADRWARSNKDLKAEDALKFAENKDWDPSVKALVAFPDILHRLSDDVDWTQRLGDAFLSNEESVMNAVQRLRKRAYATGNLDKAQHITVDRDDDNITIEPAEERVVYVPVYDTRVVYGNWWWPEYPPVYWNYPSNYTYVSGFYWGTSVYLGPSYFYSSMQWRDRRVVVIDRHYRYDNNPRFYSGRSIAHFEGSREWQHDPMHRHGVAYYNNNLRQTYGSNHESYQNDRAYREQHRDISHGNQDPRMIRNFDNNLSGKNDNRVRIGINTNDSNNGRQFDHAEQVRDRLNRSNNENTSRENITTSGLRAPSQVNDARAGANRTNQGNQVDANNTDTNNRFNQGHRIVTDGADRRPNISAPANNIQPAVTRQPDASRNIEAEANRNEARAEQRTERMSQHFSREKNDDKDKNK